MHDANKLVAGNDEPQAWQTYRMLLTIAREQRTIDRIHVQELWLPLQNLHRHSVQITITPQKRVARQAHKQIVPNNPVCKRRDAMVANITAAYRRIDRRPPCV